MRKVKNLFVILIITALLLNMFLPVVLANFETMNKEDGEVSYNDVYLEDDEKLEDSTILVDDNKNEVIEDNKTIMDEEIVEDEEKAEDVEDVTENEKNNIEEKLQENIQKNTQEKIQEKVEENVQEEVKEDNNIIRKNVQKEIVKEDTNEDYGIMLLDNAPSLGVQYRTHVQYAGWQNYVQNGATAGTSGQGLRLEGINIKLANAEKNLNIKYQVHIQNIGWQSWKKNGEMAGTSGQSLRLEAIRICLEDSDEYSIMYRVHVQNIGWQGWKYDGEMAGTSGQALRLEAIQIKIVPKQKKGKLYLDTPSKGSTYYSSNNINVQGWKMANISNTSIKAYIDNTEVASNTITYYNRKDVTNSIVEYGTANQNPNAGFKFTVNTANLSNGNHTIKVVLYSGSTTLTTINSTFKVDKNIHVNYRSHVQYVGWQGYVMDGQMSGTSGKSYRVEALNINLINVPTNAKILYRTHVQNIGWQGWKSNGEMAGTSGQGLRVEALEIKLENLNDYTVEYQVHIQDKGWSNWYIDGETAGTVGESKRIEAIKIRIVPHYKRQYKGIDVSGNNGSINWALVKRDNVDFAMIRIGYRGYGQAGRIAEDPKGKLNIEAAKKAGVKVGVYFYTQAINEAEAIEEANWVIDRIKGYGINYPVAVDFENSGANGRADNLDRNTRTKIAKAFCQTIQNAGYKPMVYTNVNWANNYINMNELTKYETWIAHWTYSTAKLPSYSKGYTMWQYSNKGVVNGVPGNVDLNVGYKKY